MREFPSAGLSARRLRPLLAALAPLAGAGCGDPPPPPPPPPHVIFGEPQPYQIEVLSATAGGESFLGRQIAGRVNGTADWTVRVRLPMEKLPDDVRSRDLEVHILDPTPTNAPPEFLPGTVLATDLFPLAEVSPGVYEATFTMRMPKQMPRRGAPDDVRVAVMSATFDEGGSFWRSDRAEIARMTLSEGAE